jgi:hypothetical protein
MEASEQRSFRLPVSLFTDLRTAASLADKDVSDVVREILEAHIGQYLEDAAKARHRRLQERVTAVVRDPVLSKLFTKYKDKKGVPLISAGLDRVQAIELLDAFKAHKELKEAKAETELPGEESELDELWSHRTTDSRNFHSLTSSLGV